MSIIFIYFYIDFSMKEANFVMKIVVNSKSISLQLLLETECTISRIALELFSV